LYSEIPISGIGDFTVGRLLDTATRVNSNGNIEVVNANIPRLDYYTSGGTAGCPALLVEPSGSNLYQRSEDFTNAYWSKVNSSVSGNQAVAPDGTSTAGKLIMNNGILPNAVNQSGFNRTEVVTSSAYRFSMFAKSAEFTGFRVRENLAAGTFLDVNLSNGTITNGDVAQFISPLAENYGNGWYRISWTSPTITNLNKYTIRVGSTGDGVSGIFVWGAQVETGSIATSYIPTTTAAVTRNADVISVSGAVSGCIGQTQGTLYAEVDIRLISGTRVVLDINDGGLTNRALINIANNVIGGFVQGSTIVSYTAPSAGIYKIAFAYQSANFSLFVNGVERQTSANVISFSGMNQIFLGHTFSTSFLNDRIRAAALYPTRLSNGDLQTLTQL
jgi:hypothetical protein